MSRGIPTIFDHRLYSSPMERADVVQSELLSLVLYGFFRNSELGLVGLA